jgi:O-antigen/teichoic acid export membrane protein
VRSLLADLGPRSRYAAAALAGQLVFAIIAFGGAVLVARLLGAAGKGEYTAWTLGTSIGTFVLAASLPVGLGRAYLDQQGSAVLTVALRHAMIVATVMAIGVGFAVLAGVDPVPLVWCLLIAVPAGTIGNDILVVMQAAKRPWSFQAIRIVHLTVFTAGMALVALLEASDPLNLAFVLWGLGALASAATACGIALRMFGSSRRSSLREYARLGRGSYLAGLIGWFLFRLDQLILVAVAGPYALGLYSVAVNCAEAVQYLGAATAQSVFEDQRTLDQQAAGRILRRAARILTVALLLTVAAGFFLIGPIFGEPFEDARWALLLLGPGVVAHGLAYTTEQILFARGEGWRVSRIALITLAAALFAWTSGAYVFGVEGIAAAASAVYLLQFVLVRRALFREPTDRARVTLQRGQDDGGGGRTGLR